MSEQTEIIRLNLEVSKFLVDIQKSKENIKDLDKAIKSLTGEKGAAGKRNELIIEKGKAEANLKSLQSELKKTQKAIDDTEKNSTVSFLKMATGIGVAIAAAKKIWSTLSGYVQAAREGVIVEKQLSAVIKSTGNAAGVTQKEMLNLAESLQAATGIEKSQIASAEAMLLTFTKIGGSIIPQATEAVLNMSKVFGGDGKTQAIQLGKALNDPITGLTALRRVGVMFTADQEKQIKSFMAHNDILSAQKVILKEIETEFGGMARATGSEFTALESNMKQFHAIAGIVIVGFLTPFVRGFSELYKAASYVVGLALPDEFKNVSKNIKDSFENLEKLRTELQGLTKDQLEKKLAEVNEELSKLEKAATGSNNIYETFNDTIKENANAIKLTDDILGKYSDSTKIDIDLTKKTIVETDKFSGSLKQQEKQFSANAQEAFELKKELEDLKKKIEDLIKPPKISGTASEEEIKQIKKFRELNEKYNQEDAESLEKYNQEKEKSNLKYYEWLHKKEQEEMEARTKRGEKALKDEKKRLKEEVKATQEAEEKKKQARIAQQQFYIDSASTLTKIATEMNAYELQEIDNKYKAESQLYAQQLANNTISKELYDKKMLILENKVKKEKTKLLKQQQKIDIAIATIDTAKGVLNAFNAKDNLFTWQMWTQAALAAALGAFQIKTIASQKFAGGTVFKGRTHAQGGINIGNNQEVENDEMLLTAGVYKNKAARKIASGLNEMFGGIELDRTPVNYNVTRVMQSGGIVSGSSNNDMKTLIKGIETLNANVGALELKVNINQRIESDIIKVTDRITEEQNRQRGKGYVLEQR
ncbi:MAG TPA: phage tail length tape measure family protein [Spirochaetota bacterium]|nr:phage tail length tape measure family protein [Spirochaetota bacterium]